MRQTAFLARRLIERGVRFAQLFHPDWDHHSALSPRGAWRRDAGIRIDPAPPPVERS
jgi:hypothetical protein